MSFYFVKTPKVLASFYKKYIWHYKTEKKTIYLTFDDGPTPEITTYVLDTLKKYNAKATFFCLGKNIKKYPNLFHRIIAEGHAVGNHTQNHLNGWKTDINSYINDVDLYQEVINAKVENKPIKLFRPPYGRIKKAQAKILINKGYKIMMWSVLSADFDTKISKEQCLNNVIKNTKKGDIIVFHDSNKAFERLKYTLPKALDYFMEKGYSIEKI